jgi:uncharacterized protein with ParB-like and HNH nuclease domain
MDAKTVPLHKALQSKCQFVVPIYQRNYSWNEKQNYRLLQDIINVGRSRDATHFLGSIVYIAKSFQPSFISELQLIDGQQRITTVSILLYVLYEKIDDEDIKNDIMDLLINRNKKGNKRYKILLSQQDSETYARLLNGETDICIDDSLVDNTYRFFRRKLSPKTKSELQLIWQGILKLVVVQISLFYEHDDPQLIFETLNSTGKDLTEADKIRNYLLMNLDQGDQENVYINKWLPIERLFNKADKDDRFDRFVRDFLTMKYGNGRIPTLGNVYEEFKEFSDESDANTHQIADDLRKYSRYYACIHLNREKNKKLAKAFNDIKSIRVEVSYPFLLEVYADYMDGIINEKDIEEIIRVIESYTYRRQVCDLPTRGQNTLFARMISEIDKDNYVESIKCNFLARKNEYRFPSDQEFEDKFASRDMFNFRPKFYTLLKLENSYHPKSLVNKVDYSVEHIMPQKDNLSAEWKNMLGPDYQRIHETYLHTIGNLTLTAYNSEMSDKPFKAKKSIKGGFDSSPLSLNKTLFDINYWNEDAILSRSVNLASKATIIWSKPLVDRKVLDYYTEKKGDVDDYDIERLLLNKDESIRNTYNDLFGIHLRIDSEFDQEAYKYHVKFHIKEQPFSYACIYQEYITLYFYSWCDFDQLKVYDEKKWLSAIKGDNGDWRLVRFSITPLQDMEYAYKILKSAYDLFKKTA